MLLKLVFDLIKNDKPTVEEIRCARTIIDNLIKVGGWNGIAPEQTSDLDEDARQARKELM